MRQTLRVAKTGRETPYLILNSSLTNAPKNEFNRMSRIKDHLIGLCNERDEALCALDGLEFDNSSALFYGYGTLIPPSLEFDHTFPHCGYYALLLTQLENIMDVARLNGGHNFKRVVYGMAYSHSVTLLESYISQSLVALATQYSNFATRITQHYDPSGAIKKIWMEESARVRGRLKRSSY